MERTTVVEGTVFLGTTELSNIMRMLVRGYKFTHENRLPKLVVIPVLDDVDGVKLHYERLEVSLIEPVKPKGKK